MTPKKKIVYPALIAVVLIASYLVFSSIVTDDGFPPPIGDPDDVPGDIEVNICSADILFLIDHTSRVRVNSDVPGSGEYFPTMIQTLKESIQAVPQKGICLTQLRFGLMVYDANIDFQVNFDETQDVLFNTLDSIWASEPSAGWEDMAGAMSKAQDVFENSTNDNKFIILISDGRTSVRDPSLVDSEQITMIRYEIVPNATQSEIIFHTYGFPSYRYTFSYMGDSNYDLLSDIASISGGIYMRGNDSEDFTEFLDSIFQLLLTISY